MRKFFFDILYLHKGEADKQATLEYVKENIHFSGSTLWILACAIIIASVGLNVNSTAVVIGAMLISPLMGPIVGAGFALGIYDFALLKKSIYNLLTATLVSLLFSFFYFYISPFKQAQSELLSRTSPNIYDVLIAFFGGLVGVIAITRVEKGNPIPGVAIATALMPPLCTAGYALATAKWTYFFGALFLYSINCVFIGIATFLIVKYLNYPTVKQLDAHIQRRVRIIISSLILIVLLPSAYFAFVLYGEQKFLEKANDFIEKECAIDGKTLVYKKINSKSEPKTIELAFLDKSYSEQELEAIQTKALQNGLENTKIIIRKNSQDNLQVFKDDILNEINKQDNELNVKDQMIADLQNKLNHYTFDNSQLLTEINVLFPTIKSISLSTQSMKSTDSVFEKTILLYQSEKPLNSKESTSLAHWLEAKLQLNNIDLLEVQ
ncbi:MAG: DUF389 domain-containing protein [Chitinophagaceae bacterium]